MVPSPLATPQLEAAAGVLARAFQEDPGTLYFFPESKQRAAMLPAIFNVMIRHGLKHGFVYSAPAIPLGVAIWLPPGKTTPDDADIGAAGIGEVAGMWGHEAMGRLGSLVAQLEMFHGQLIQGPHWRLFFLGVDPEHQGEGIGGALVDARPSSQIDTTPTYLETFTIPNVRFYQRHGYRVVAENDISETSLHVWSMLRD